MGARLPKLHSGVALVEVRDPLVLMEIENDPGIRHFLGERLSDRCVAVQPQAVEEVLARLRALGHMPSVVEAPPPPRKASAKPPQ